MSSDADSIVRSDAGMGSLFAVDAVSPESSPQPPPTIARTAQATARCLLLVALLLQKAFELARDRVPGWEITK